jgi:hypothetical protein
LLQLCGRQNEEDQVCHLDQQQGKVEENEGCQLLVQVEKTSSGNVLIKKENFTSTILKLL